MKNIKIHQNDEVYAEVNLPFVGEIPIIYLDQNSSDIFFHNAVSEIVDHGESIIKEVTQAAYNYMDKVAPDVDKKFEITSIFVYEGKTNEIGVSLHWDGDIEHGVGIQIINYKVTEVGMEDGLFS